MTTTDTTAEKARNYANRLRDEASDFDNGTEDLLNEVAAFLDSATLTASPAQELSYTCDACTTGEFVTCRCSPAQGEWISVPREPTEAMLKSAMIWLAHWQHMRKADRENALSSAWSAMLAAAPVAPSPGEWIERESAARAIQDLAEIARYRAQNGSEDMLVELDAAADAFCEATSTIRALPSTPKPQELAGER